MNDHYPEPTNELRDEDLINNPVEDERKQPLTFVYDLARVPTLTAYDLQRIENTLYQPGISPEEGQSIIYGELERMGLKFEDVQHGAVVVNFVDTEDNQQLRPVRVNYDDFGTYVQGAQLDNIGENNSDNEEEEQQQMLGVVLGNIRKDIEIASGKAEEVENMRRYEIVNEALAHLEALAGRLVNHEIVQQNEIAQLAQDENVKKMQELINQEASDRDTQSKGYIAVKRLTDEVGERRHQNPNINNTHQDLLGLKIKSIEAAVDDMQSNRRMLARGTEEAKWVAGSIFGTIDQLLASDRLGYENYGSSLKQQVGMLRETIEANRKLSDAFPGLVKIAITLAQ